MAIFCLVLATVTFVLLGGPQACRCDRPPIDETGGFDGNIWKSIHNHLVAGEGKNSISTAKLPVHDIPWNSPQPTGPNANELMLLQSLINRYRKYMVERFVRFDDACWLLFGAETTNGEDEDDSEEPPQNVVEASTNSPPTDASAGMVGGGRGESFRPEINRVCLFDFGSRSSFFAFPFPAFHPMIETLQIKRPTRSMLDLCSRTASAKQYYHCLFERFNDGQLMSMLQEYAETYCGFVRHNDNDPFERSTVAAGLQKRDTPRYVSKQKFHSWGGKRNTAQVFYPWGGKRTMPRTHKQPKVVIRNPFHSWGGKRSGSEATST
uniref:Leucokinin n=1 Tax=Anopheles epiroticus TaxID=199890 RepID=A0A182PRW8_9DIPT